MQHYLNNFKEQKQRRNNNLGQFNSVFIPQTVKITLAERDKGREAAGSKLTNPLVDIADLNEVQKRKDQLENLLIETNTLKNESTYNISQAVLS